jgi:hypothetical protein
MVRPATSDKSFGDSNAGQAISTVPSTLGTGGARSRPPDPAAPPRTHPGLQLRARLPFGAVTIVAACEQRLEARFGANYAAYRRQVKRWIPGIL